MRTDTDYRAILIADCGVEHTRVSLVDVIGESEYRLVAQREMITTADPPFSDVTASIRQAIVELEWNTGRQLLEDGRLRIPQGRDSQGVDAFVATCSAGGALPVLVLAVTADISARSALLAIEGTYAVPFRVVTMEEVLRDDPLAEEQEEATLDLWWRVIEEIYPGGVLMVGGIDGGNLAPLRTLARSLAEALSPRPARLEQELPRPPLSVIYAGNARAQEVVQQHLADHVDLRVVDNVRPSMRQARLLPVRQEILRLYEEQILQSLPGYEELASWSQGPIQLPYMGLQLATRFLAAHHRRRVLAVDLGSGSTAVVWADEERSVRTVLGHLGMGYGIARVLARQGPARIRQWIPFALSDDEVRDWVLNHALRPRTVPATVRDYLIHQAVAREALVEAMTRLREQTAGDYEIVVATGGGLARAPRLAQAVLVLLDALQPTGGNPAGLVDLYLDRCCLLPSVGALATLNPDAAACVLLKDGLFHLGPCLVPLGRGRAGARALAVELEYASGMRQQAEVPWGEIVIIPFRMDGQAHLTVKPARGARLGLGRSGEQLTTKGGEMISGGGLGLIVDTRGRPLELPEEDEQRWSALREWFERSGAYAMEEMAALTPAPPPEEEGPAEEEAGEEQAQAEGL